jgi:hypothetical protein
MLSYTIPRLPLQAFSNLSKLIVPTFFTPTPLTPLAFLSPPFLPHLSTLFYALVFNTIKNLAKFGYRSERKVEIFKNPDIFWWPAGTYFLNMVISQKYFGDFWCNFFTKILCVSLIGLYSLLPSDQNSPPKKHTGPHEGYKTTKS